MLPACRKGKVTLTLTENITHCSKGSVSFFLVLNTCYILVNLTCSKTFVVDFGSEKVDSFATNPFKSSFSVKRAPVAQSVLENKTMHSFASFL